FDPERREYLFQHPAALFDGEQRVLFRIVENGNNDLVEQGTAPPNDVEVAVRERVERSRKYSSTHYLGDAEGITEEININLPGSKAEDTAGGSEFLQESFINC